MTIDRTMGGARMKLARTSGRTGRFVPLLAGFLCVLVAGTLTAWAQADFQGATRLMPFEEDSINYNQATPNDAIQRLLARLAAGEARLRHDAGSGYLLPLLKELGIDSSSQMLVYSKTSLQRERISPATPRSLFFNDSVYIGFIPGAPLIEISTADPKLGGVFYTLDQTQDQAPKFARNNQCLECHASAKSMGVPGHLVRSFETDENGVIDMTSGTSLVNHRTPFAERWGGWYVTGVHGAQLHRGNLVGKAAFERQQREPNYAGNQTNLVRFCDTSRYPRPTSDIVALMVLEHQTHMHNFITRLQYESTLALEQYGHLNYMKSAIEAFLRYLLFVDEAPLTAPVRGNPDYARWFQAQGPRDPLGRSLRELDLHTRMFKYPCSYLIHSEAFAALPAPLKQRLYERLATILSGDDPNPDFRRLAAAERTAVRAILTATLPDLPESWRATATAGPAASAGGG